MCRVPSTSWCASLLGIADGLVHVGFVFMRMVLAREDPMLVHGLDCSTVKKIIIAAMALAVGNDSQSTIAWCLSYKLRHCETIQTNLEATVASMADIAEIAEGFAAYLAEHCSLDAQQQKALVQRAVRGPDYCMGDNAATEATRHQECVKAGLSDTCGDLRCEHHNLDLMAARGLLALRSLEMADKAAQIERKHKRPPGALQPMLQPNKEQRKALDAQAAAAAAAAAAAGVPATAQSEAQACAAPGNAQGAQDCTVAAACSPDAVTGQQVDEAESAMAALDHAPAVPAMQQQPGSKRRRSDPPPRYSVAAGKIACGITADVWHHEAVCGTTRAGLSDIYKAPYTHLLRSLPKHEQEAYAGHSGATRDQDTYRSAAVTIKYKLQYDRAALQAIGGTGDDSCDPDVTNIATNIYRAALDPASIIHLMAAAVLHQTVIMPMSALLAKDSKQTVGPVLDDILAQMQRMLRCTEPAGAGSVVELVAMAIDPQRKLNICGSTASTRSSGPQTAVSSASAATHAAPAGQGNVRAAATPHVAQQPPAASGAATSAQLADHGSAMSAAPEQGTQDTGAEPPVQTERQRLASMGDAAAAAVREQFDLQNMKATDFGAQLITKQRAENKCFCHFDAPAHSTQARIKALLWHIAAADPEAFAGVLAIDTQQLPPLPELWDTSTLMQHAAAHGELLRHCLHVFVMAAEPKLREQCQSLLAGGALRAAHVLAGSPLPAHDDLPECMFSLLKASEHVSPNGNKLTMAAFKLFKVNKVGQLLDRLPLALRHKFLQLAQKVCNSSA